MVTGDTLFAPLSSSDKTTVDYPYLFDWYHENIIEGLSKKWPATLATFGWVNQRVFAHFGDHGIVQRQLLPDPTTYNQRNAMIMAMFAAPLAAADPAGPIAFQTPIVEEEEEHDRDGYPPSDFLPDSDKENTLSVTDDSSNAPFSRPPSPAAGAVLAQALQSMPDAIPGDIAAATSTAISTVAVSADIPAAPPGLTKMSTRKSGGKASRVSTARTQTAARAPEAQDLDADVPADVQAVVERPRRVTRATKNK